MRLLDLFCGGGGAGMGYHRAGFDVVGVDINPQKRYPFTFVQMNAIEAMFRLWIGLPIHDEIGLPWYLSDFDAIHASPPCQAYTRAGHVHKKEHPDMIPATRLGLRRLALPYVIENVEGSPLQGDLMLCGTMFGLNCRRHRIFETTLPMMLAPYTCRCAGRAVTGELLNYHNTAQRNLYLEKHPDTHKIAFGKALGVEWMSFDEAQEAIPPAYTEFVGRRMLAELVGVAA